MGLQVTGYEVGELLGTGSHAQVWAATECRSGTPVALKHFVAADRADRTAAQREATLLTSLDHPALVRCHDVIETDAGIVLVLDLAGGGTLSSLVRRRGTLTPGEVAACLAPIGSALAHAHSEGVVHGDLSPANILFAADGRPMLADLGVATLFGAGRDLIGTPAYADPVVVCGGSVLPATDVFGLGAVALYSLTGLGPWQQGPDDTTETVLARAARASPVDLADRLGDRCPVEVRHVLEGALQPDPHRRPSAAAFALDLRAAAGTTRPVLAAGRARSDDARPAAGRHSRTGMLLAAERSAVPGAVVVPDRDAGVLTGEGRPAFVRPASAVAPGGLSPERTVLRRVRPRPAPAQPVRSWWLRLAGRVTRGRDGGGRDDFWASPVAEGGNVSGVHRRPVATRPRPGPSWVSRSRVRRTVAVAIVGVLVGTAAVIVGYRCLLPRLHGPSASAAAAPRGAASTGSGPVSPRSAAAAGDGAQLASAAAEALRSLDAARSAAYEKRSTDGLAAVYDSDALLQADRRQLLHVVPAGCGLLGLRTSFTDLTASVARASGSAQDLVVVTAQAVVSPARIVCRGTVVSEVAGRGRTPMTIVLRSSTKDGGLRIAVMGTG